MEFGKLTWFIFAILRSITISKGLKCLTENRPLGYYKGALQRIYATKIEALDS